MVGLGPTIHPSTCSDARGWLDPRDKPEDDRKYHPREADHQQPCERARRPMPKAVRPGPSPPPTSSNGKRARSSSAKSGGAKPSPARAEEIFRRFAAANPEPKGELE